MTYLQYIQVKGAAGINHQLLNLQCLLREAAHLGRTAVLPPLRLTPRHNSGVAVDGQWKTYFDLCASRLADERSGEERRLPLVDRLPPRLLRTFTLSADVKRMPLRAKDFELVCRRVPAWFPRQVPRSGLDMHLHLRVRPSQRVLALALPVIDGPGSLPDGYAAVHIRRGDRKFGKLERQTSPSRIRKTLREQGVCEGSTVFFLSNEHDPAFWAELAPHYHTVRFTDYPHLVELVSAQGDGLPDNYLLYEVEKEIMRHARIRIDTLPARDWTDRTGTLVGRATLRQQRRRFAPPWRKRLRSRLRHVLTR